MKLLLVVLIIFPVCLFAQIESGSKFIYSGLSYTPKPANRISPVIGFYFVDDKKNINDFQMNHLNFNKSESYTSFSVSGSYHRIIGLNKNKDSKFYLGAGVGASLYNYYTAFRPETSNLFYTSNTKIGTLISVKPVVNYAFSEKLYLGMSANIGVLNQSVVFARYDNPVLPTEQQRDTYFNTELGGLRNLSFDLTLGFKIN